MAQLLLIPIRTTCRDPLPQIGHIMKSCNLHSEYCRVTFCFNKFITLQINNNIQFQNSFHDNKNLVNWRSHFSFTKSIIEWNAIKLDKILLVWDFIEINLLKFSRSAWLITRVSCFLWQYLMRPCLIVVRLLSVDLTRNNKILILQYITQRYTPLRVIQVYLYVGIVSVILYKQNE